MIDEEPNICLYVKDSYRKSWGDPNRWLLQVGSSRQLNLMVWVGTGRIISPRVEQSVDVSIHPRTDRKCYYLFHACEKTIVRDQNVLGPLIFTVLNAETLPSNRDISDSAPLSFPPPLQKNYHRRHTPDQRTGVITFSQDTTHHQQSKLQRGALLWPRFTISSSFALQK